MFKHLLYVLVGGLLFGAMGSFVWFLDHSQCAPYLMAVVAFYVFGRISVDIIKMFLEDRRGNERKRNAS